MGDLRCIDCGAELRRGLDHPTHLSCEGCGRRFPLVGGRIPLLVAEPETYLARLYVQHAHHLRRQQERAEALERRAAEEPARATTLRALAQALQANAAIIEAAKQELRPHLTIDDVVEALRAPDFIGYASTLEYLERDWCGLPEGERELDVILGEIHEALGSPDAVKGSVVVLGAGAGRVAWELRRRFDRVVALDASMTMAQHFHAVLDGPVCFHAVGTSSMRTDAEMVVPRVTTGPEDRGHRARVEYVVADATRIPLVDHGVAAIVSVYFTDVLPLRRYLAEVVRLLQPGGRFVHFGPLEYHFDDPAEHLSLVQVRRTFVDAGFEVGLDRQVPSEHLARPGSIARRVFDNWSFSATKVAGRPAASGMALDPRAEPVVAAPLEYRAVGGFTTAGHHRGEVELRVGDACFRVSAVVLDILAACGQGATVARIVERTCEGEHGLTAAGVERLLEQLFRVGALVTREG